MIWTQVGIGLAIAVLGAFLGMVLWGAGRYSFRPGREMALKAGAILLGVGMVSGGGVYAYQGWTGQGGTVIPPGGGTQPAWDWRVDTSAAGNFINSNHDANTEFPDAPFTACGSSTPAGTIGTFNTNVFYDTNSMTLTQEITVDNDVPPTTAGYSAPDCMNFDILFQVSNFVDNNNDSIMDNIAYFGRWRDWSTYTIIEGAGNGTQAYTDQLFEHTNAGGWQFGFGTEVDAPAWAHAASDHGYSGSCVPGTPGYSTVSPTDNCVERWVPLGIYDDGDPDTVNPWWDFRNSGPFGYKATKGMRITAAIDIGVPSSYFTINFVFILDAID